MVNFLSCRFLIPLAWVVSLPAHAQTLPAQEIAAVDNSSTRTPASQAVARTAADGSILTRKDARTITLKIPAPRGLIVDREGEPFAQNKVAYQVALQFPQFEVADRNFVIRWARTRLNALQGLVAKSNSKTDDELYDHYRHRRWLPLLVSGLLDDKEAETAENSLPSGLVLHPIYARHYPHGELAAHIIGYSGSVGKLPTGPINFNEPLWEESEGRAGFEKLFNRQLTGEDGMKRLLFDENGNKLLEEQVKRPRAGGTLVTTLNLKWQKLAEEVLRKGTRRGAFVVIDAVTGEVLVMASRPSFDLNRFIPGIGEKEYQDLQDDPASPLYGRAFQSNYPPASAFKPIIALAALNNGVVTEHSTVYCPASIRVGNATFRNWTKTPEGSINVRRALARSTNPWFYQVGIDVGPSAFLSVARRLGYGERTGLPLLGETPGLVPNDEWMLKHEKRRILDGDTANMSIGQGSLLASPLQVAQGMAGIANGGVLPKLQLIRQIHDTRGRVVQATVPERKHWLGIDAKAVEIVRGGMQDVVSKGYGTGTRAGLSYTTLAGKTGTAQWGPPSKNQRLAWFAGFLPHDNPRYAFAVLYEGRPGETVSGGKMAAPMVKNFFEPLEDEIKDIIAPPQKALVVIDEADGLVEGDEADGLVEGDEIPAPLDVIEESPVEGPLRALPVDMLPGEEPGPGTDDALEPAPLEIMPDIGLAPIEPPPPMRAIPVTEDEIIEDAFDPPDEFTDDGLDGLDGLEEP